VPDNPEKSINDCKAQTGCYGVLRLKRKIRCYHPSSMGPVAQSLQRLATGWTVWESNPGGGEIFRTCPDRPWGPPSLLYNGYRDIPGGKERPGRDADPSPPSSAIGHARVEVYLYSSYGPYGLCRDSVPVQGCTLHLPAHPARINFHSTNV
jgi:hypothetical protein